jgi:sugar phosphate isomerase/epimerase
MVPGHPTIPLALALRGLLAPPERGADIGPSLRNVLAWSGTVGFSAVCLDTTVAGLRARDLDRSARRDLAASMRRVGLASGGIDLLLPPEHLTDPRHADRAIAAAVGALGLAADLAGLTQGRAVVAMVLPPPDGPTGWRDALVSEAQRVGARIADFAAPESAHADPASPFGIGIDTAAALAAGTDPARAISRAAPALDAVRLADWDGSARVPIGRGRLDELALRVAIATSGFAGFVAVDTRGLADPRTGAQRALERFGGRSKQAGTP